MEKRVKKPPVKPEIRRDWLKRAEEEGESPPEIAAKDGFDVRTVRKQIETARQEREAREARAVVLRDALEKHYADLRRIAEKLNSEILGLTRVPSLPDDDLMEDALKQHMPRSPIWSLLSKRKDLLEKARGQEQKLKSKTAKAVKSDKRVVALIGTGLNEVFPGIIEVLVFEAKQWARGETDRSLRDNVVMEPAGRGLVNPHYGSNAMGVMETALADGYVSTIDGVIEDLESRMKAWADYRGLERTTVELGRLDRKLREELAVIRLRRIVTGRCKFCPI